MKKPKHETRVHYVEGNVEKPSYENLEEELIHMYPQIDLLKLQLIELKNTITSLCDASVLRGELDYKRALDVFNQKIQLTELTRLSVVALEAAKTVAALRKETDKAILLDHAVASTKIIVDHVRHN